MENIEKVVSTIRARSDYSKRVYTLTVMIVLMLSFSLVLLFVYGANESMLVQGPVESNTMLLALIGSVIVRLGAVAIAIYVIQIFFTLARYHMRLSQHLSSTADALELANGDSEQLDILLKHLTPIALDFGKTPIAPNDNLGKVLEELIKKIPSSN